MEISYDAQLERLKDKRSDYNQQIGLLYVKNKIDEAKDLTINADANINIANSFLGKIKQGIIAHCILTWLIERKMTEKLLTYYNGDLIISKDDLLDFAEFTAEKNGYKDIFCNQGYKVFLDSFLGLQALNRDSHGSVKICLGRFQIEGN